MRIKLYRKLKGANPEDAIVAGNLRLNGADFLAPGGVDSENLFEVDVNAAEGLPQTRKAVVDAIVNPNQHSYLLQADGRREGDLKRGHYEATIAVKTDIDPEAIGYESALKERYGLGDSVAGVRRYTLWHLTFNRQLTRQERRAYVKQLRDFFANPNFQKARVSVG